METKESKMKSVPRYKFNLDEHPSKRWANIVKENKEKIKNIEGELDKFMKEIVLSSSLMWLMKKLAEWGKVLYSEELISISKESGISLGKLTAMQLVYEMFACCTSIIANESQHKYPIHIRTMDWDFSFLKDITIELEYIRGGQTIGIVTTWLGYVGVLTGMRNNQYAVSVNYRRSDKPSLWTNIIKAITYEWPIGFLLRTIIENDDNFNTALTNLQTSKLIAPCYFIVSGTKPGDAYIVIRNRDSAFRTYNNKNDETGHHPLIQTNIDSCIRCPRDNILWSYERYNATRQLLEQNKNFVNEGLLWEIVNTHPMNNEETVYATFMCAKTMQYETKVFV